MPGVGCPPRCAGGDAGLPARALPQGGGGAAAGANAGPGKGAIVLPAAGIEIVNLREFRRDLRRAIDARPRELARAIREAGKPALAEARRRAPRRSGRLAASLRIQTRGTSGSIVSRAPYGAGAEWGRRGRWRGFTRNWGSPPRYAWPAIEAKQEEIAEIIFRELRAIVTAHGWFREA